MTALWLLASVDRRERIRAIRTLRGDSPALGYALRRVLFTDGDAVVRAAAARRLGALADTPSASAWLVEALIDGAPLVRDAALRGLALCGDPAARPSVQPLARHDRVWWVRRSALYALGALVVDIGDINADVAAFEDALRDPFWRVRHAAVKVLTALAARDPSVRDHVRDLPASDAQVFLRASWGPVALEAPARAAAASALPEALRDPDPAVVTARLAEDRTVSPIALVELLCDPHVPLRELAAERVAASGDRAAYRAALDWLEEPRIPYVAETVERLLDGLGDPAAELAALALATPARTGAARWAIGWVVATGDDPLRELALVRARADASLRQAALPLAELAELVAWAREAGEALRVTRGPHGDVAVETAALDAAVATRDVAGAEVATRDVAGAEAAAREAGALLDAIAATLHARGAQAELLSLPDARPRVRALQLDVRGRRGERDAIADAATRDPHYGPRAIAARWWIQLDREAAVASGIAHDSDPAVREASLCVANAAMLLGDPDPFVARAAIEALVVGARHAEPAQQAALAAVDPWIRAQACRLPLAVEAVPVILERLGDPDEAVRAAALDALERGLADGSSLDAAIAALLADDALSPLGRTMARAWLARALDDAALARLAEMPDAVATMAALVRLAEVPGMPAHAPAVERRAPANVERRAIPRAGFAIAPLVISGAFDLSPAAMASATEAGVDTWFWEPSYDRLTAHLRTQPRAHVIAGSYHADAASIGADVDRTLRRLGRDAIDVFLLFWSRSPSRVDPAAYDVLARLQRAGKIRATGFSTHDRGLARAAIEASPWDLVMIRHSAAHPGIEADLLPTARATRTAILTFSALCYGRMVSGPGAPSPADCYRYSLSQPGVVGCISAPRRRREVLENLAALRSPQLDDAQLAALRAHGVGVRAENQRFNALLRQPTRDAAAAARELLLAELDHAAAPDEALALPSPRRARGARSSRRVR